VDTRQRNIDATPTRVYSYTHTHTHTHTHSSTSCNAHGSSRASDNVRSFRAARRFPFRGFPCSIRPKLTLPPFPLNAHSTHVISPLASTAAALWRHAGPRMRRNSRGVVRLRRPCWRGCSAPNRPALKYSPPSSHPAHRRCLLARSPSRR